MRRYEAADEQAIRIAGDVRDWKQSGLLDASRAAAIEGELRTSLKRTHWALRAVLFFFTASVIQSAVGLLFIVVAPREGAVAGSLALLVGAGCWWITDYLVGEYGLYRFGVEEATAISSIVLVAGGLTMFASIAGVSGDWLMLVALLTGSVASAMVYWRFGLLYTAIAAAGSAAAISFLIDLSEAWARLLAAAVLLTIHIASGLARQPHDEDYPGDDYGVIEAVTWLGVYALLNVQLTGGWSELKPASAPAFYWATCAAIWILPAIGLYRGVAAKHRWMIRVNLLMLLTTLATWKMYLGWPQRTWDPILLGLLLVAAAVGIRRWLLNGGEGRRDGFTPNRLLSSDEDTMAQVALAAALNPDPTIRETRPADDLQTGGGRSGGAGAGAGF
jgi:hypothetical protein